MTFPKAHRWQTLRPGWTRGPRFPTTRLVLDAPSLFTQSPGILRRPPYQVALCSKKLQKPTACQPEAELRGLAFRDLHSLGPFWPPRPLTPPGTLPLLCQSPLRLALAPGALFGLGGFAHSPPSAWSERLSICPSKPIGRQDRVTDSQYVRFFHRTFIHSAPIVHHGVGDLPPEERVKQTKSRGRELR